jgi:hypothetical protein
MVRIGVISDTHLMGGTGLPGRIPEVFEGVDRILHAGDLVAESVLEALEEIAPVLAVHGNMDYPGVRQRLPRRHVLTVEEVRIGLIHGHGVSGYILSRRDYEAMHDYLLTQFTEPVDCIVYGHTHAAQNTRHKGVLFFNPGTATGRGAPPSVGILTVDGRDIKGELVWL